ALEAKGLVAVAQVAIRNKERLCALRAPTGEEDDAGQGGGRILLETLYYPDEIRTAQLDPLDLEEVSEEELQMAFTLIGMLEKPFAPEEYHDEYREALMAVINAKLEGVELAEAAEPETAKIVDLMAALRASVEAAGSGGDGSEAADDTAVDEPAAAEARAS
ncbi:MAG: Ku protein, partial [Chloroflexi bacterium]|nr:Ku protein [Chloroflexota bacterium]